VLSLLPLTVPEVRRLLLALTEKPERFHFRLAWSYWRRRHQAIAKRCHMARRARRPVLLRVVVPPTARPTPPIQDPVLSEAQWQRILPLLPPQRPPRGRPNHDHRQMVAAMLWVARTGCSWRRLPSHFGPRHTVYCRYQRWQTSGLWARIRAALDDEATNSLAIAA
jgi:transposase